MKGMLLWMLRWLYSRVVAVVHGGASRTTPTLKNSVLMEGASSLAARIRSGKVTSFEVVQAYIKRIQEVNEVLNCVVDERFEAALSEAKKADETIRSGASTAEELWRERPFLGVPFTTPDAVPVEGLCHTLGMSNRRDVKASADANAVALMRAAGAIPIACTNVSEACFLWETNNPVFGRTSNPYNTNRSAGGPFGGEACLIAACGSPIGIAPSPTLPAAFNGVFSHKPSRNLCDALGPVSRTSADLLPALAVLTTNSAPDLRLNDPLDLTQVNFFFMDEYDNPLTSPVHHDIKVAMQKAANHFRTNIKAPVHHIHLPQIQNSFLPRKPNPLKHLPDAPPPNTQRTLLFLLSSLTKQPHSHHSTTLMHTLQDLLGSNGVLVYPSHPTAAFHHNDSIAKESDCGYSALFDALGLPSTHCPAGLDSNGLPIGFQLVAALHQDRLTLAVAREIDRTFGGWTPPPTHGTLTLKNALLRASSNGAPPPPTNPQHKHPLFQ